MDYEYTLSLGLSSSDQKEYLMQAFKPLTTHLDDYDRDDFLDELSDFIEEEGKSVYLTLPFSDCFEEFYTKLITDCLILLAKKTPDNSLGANFMIINYSSDGNRLVEYRYNGKHLSVNILDTTNSTIYECEECGEELIDVIELSAHDIGTDYNCPECGAKLSFGNEKLTALSIDPLTYIVEADDEDEEFEDED